MHALDTPLIPPDLLAVLDDSPNYLLLVVPEKLTVFVSKKSKVALSNFLLLLVLFLLAPTTILLQD
jgi:hypothetical protein